MFRRPLLTAHLVTALFLMRPNVSAEVIFNFDNSTPLQSSLVSGNVNSFVATQEQSRSGNQSLKFFYDKPNYFSSWTYNLPFTISEGEISLWFYDDRGSDNPTPAVLEGKWGGAVILEDADNPSDFGAVEINNLTVNSANRYHASEGSVDRGASSLKYDSGSLPSRTKGFHEIKFIITPNSTQISVDGTPATEVAAPGSGKNLRLRIMAGSPSNAGILAGTSGLPAGYQPNYTTTATGSELAGVDASSWLYLDDLRFQATSPAANTHAMGFEINNGTPEYDRVSNYATPPTDNPHMKGFVAQWEITEDPAFVRTGSQAAFFANYVPPFESVAFDLPGIQAGSTIELWFYDAKGTDIGHDHLGASIMLEDADSPTNFLSVEIWNFRYPVYEPVPNYYLTKGSPIGFFSTQFGDRSIGWHKVEFTVSAVSSQVKVDGITNAAGEGIVFGPGANKNLRLRLMAGSSVSGSFGNYLTVNELSTMHLSSNDPYVYFDDIKLPIAPSAGISDWQLF